MANPYKYMNPLGSMFLGVKEGFDANREKVRREEREDLETQAKRLSNERMKREGAISDINVARSAEMYGMKKEEELSEHNLEAMRNGAHMMYNDAHPEMVNEQLSKIVGPVKITYTGKNPDKTYAINIKKGNEVFSHNVPKESLKNWALDPKTAAANIVAQHKSAQKDEEISLKKREFEDRSADRKEKNKIAREKISVMLREGNTKGARNQHKMMIQDYVDYLKKYEGMDDEEAHKAAYAEIPFPRTGTERSYEAKLPYEDARRRVESIEKMYGGPPPSDADERIEYDNAKKVMQESVGRAKKKIESRQRKVKAGEKPSVKPQSPKGERSPVQVHTYPSGKKVGFFSDTNRWEPI